MGPWGRGTGRAVHWYTAPKAATTHRIGVCRWSDLLTAIFDLSCLQSCCPYVGDLGLRFANLFGCR